MYEFSLSAVETVEPALRAKGFASAVLPLLSAGNATHRESDAAQNSRKTGENTIDRIVVINDLSIAKGGGTGLALLSVRLFRQLGIPVTYVCGDDGENPDLFALDVEIVALGGEHILTGDRRRALVTGIHNADAKAMLERWIDAHDTVGTVYHVHGWSKIMSPAIFVALSRVAGRSLLHAHDFFLACPNGAFYNYPSQTPCECRPLGPRCMASHCDKRSYGQKLWRAGRSARLRSILLRKDASSRRVLLLHEKMAPAFERSGYPAEMLHTLRNPVIPYRKQRICVENNSEFFFIGRLEPEKGIEDAVKAAAVAGVTLTIIGDGPLKEHLSGYGGNVQVLGWQSHSQIAEHVRRARALLMPTRYPEPFGLVAVEASQSGIPVILSDKAYLADEMVAAGIAIACDTSNSPVFAETLQHLDRMPRVDIQAMSERAFNGATRLATSPEEWRDALIDHYLNLLAGA
ncbi:glycosyltransferase family 4 protein [Pararhizobium sp. BT-229]|uniref:glycosyltransferase family 4 protein n=1 Tax=Pararhizobium sp. BT-229 TaxID=2986923 RepID=UPI0021F707B9|nr:glycosyltransferase family 4 protein [Pararhizobium sp. BT-229]MCV9967747.1 glycosyltransferase family 4 protein [Pararhizobium sp. BT-229]